MPKAPIMMTSTPFMTQVLAAFRNDWSISSPVRFFYLINP